MVVESSDHEDPRPVRPRWPVVWWWKANVERMGRGSMVAKVREDGADFSMGKEGLASFQVGRMRCEGKFPNVGGRNWRLSKFCQTRFLLSQ